MCEGTVHINTGEDEASFNRRISVTDYNKLADFVEVLTQLSELQKNPTEHEVTKTGKVKSNKLVLKLDVEVT